MVNAPFHRFEAVRVPVRPVPEKVPADAGSAVQAYPVAEGTDVVVY
jgi:hypothetical protein